MSKRIEDLDKNFKATPVKAEDSITWHTVNNEPFAVDGLPWFKENGGAFYRLPVRAKTSLRESLWILGTMPSGGRVRFKTDSPTLRARVQHSRGDAGLAMTHMCAVGCSGLDLYEGPPKKMTFWNIGRPGHVTEPYVVTLVSDLPKKMREFTIYFPAYNDLVRFEIGLAPGVKLAAPSPYRLKKTVVVYGTSITHGGCSSRVSTGWVPVVGRQLGINIVNLGFSGNGQCDPELVPLFNELDMACLVVDCVANMGLARMKTGYVPFLDAIRKCRPKLPLLLMTELRYASEHYLGSQSHNEMNAIVIDTCRQMRRQGDQNVHLLDARKIIGFEQDHPSVDGVHLTDLGFKQMADGVAPVLKRILRLKL
ncbi:MAG: SGNH/GDSL hydrolase family protein [Verrucomicrobiota bacterium]